MKSSDLTKIILVAVPVALYFFVWIPLSTGAESKISAFWKPTSNVASLKTAIQGYETAIRETGSLATKATELKNEYALVTDVTKDKMSAMIPEKMDKIVFSDEMMTLLDGVGVDSGQIVTAEPEKFETFQKHTFIVNGKGRYQTVKRVVEALEKSKRLIFIDSVSLKAEEGEYETLYSYTISAYVLTEQ